MRQLTEKEIEQVSGGSDIGAAIGGTAGAITGQVAGATIGSYVGGTIGAIGGPGGMLAGMAYAQLEGNYDEVSWIVIIFGGLMINEFGKKLKQIKTQD